MAPLWLVRTKENKILGPIAQEKLIEQLKNQAFTIQDEICHTGGHWFSLYEEKTLQKHLGLSLSQIMPISEGATQTQLQSSEDDITASLDPPQTPANREDAPTIGSQKNTFFSEKFFLLILLIGAILLFLFISWKLLRFFSSPI